MRFEDVVGNLNGTGQLPWRTDGKHCHDRYRLLLVQWQRADRECSHTLRGGEHVGKFEQLIEDIRTEEHDCTGEREATIRSEGK